MRGSFGHAPIVILAVSTVTLCSDPGLVRGQDPPGALVKPEPVSETAADCRGILIEVGASWMVVRIDGLPRRITVGGFWDNGVRRGELVPHSYRLDQLQIGDEVIVDYLQRGELNWADRILIRRRPGHQVPIQPKTLRPEQYGAWHRAMNAYQDWEERGIPLPPEYASNPPPDLTPPYPPGLAAGPPPRVVPGHIPPAKD